jgi:hypothetical protein
MVGLFSTASKEFRIGVDLLRDGVAVSQALATGKTPGSLVRAEFIEANGQAGPGRCAQAMGAQSPAAKDALRLVMSTLSTGNEWIGI